MPIGVAGPARAYHRDNKYGIPRRYRSRLRSVGNEASGVASLRAISTAEVSYSTSCANGAYAVSLQDLAKPPTGSTCRPGPQVERRSQSGYIVSVAQDAAAGTMTLPTVSTCNQPSSPPASSYFAKADPPGGELYSRNARSSSSLTGRTSGLPFNVSYVNVHGHRYSVPYLLNR